MELALEGERLCKAGNAEHGVAFLEAAVQAGTSDLKLLSAIYNQLGNAYFSLGNYAKAMDYHKLDLTLTRSIHDRLGEAKASGNLGNTLKYMGQFDEAVYCCRKHLVMSRELGDKIGEGRALYNLGNVFHTKAKHIGKLGDEDITEFPEEVKLCLQGALECYEANLQLMMELGDRSAQGRACGNIGNVYYLLGNFVKAITYHEKRVTIAKEFGDKAAERRAYSNLGNAYIFLGRFETASDYYKRSLQLAREVGDRAVEAQTCYNLGNTFTLLRDYPTAIEYHLRHLLIAQELMDKIGESRACWSLSNAHSAVGNHENALHYANKHLEISREIGDHTGQATAQTNVTDLRKVLGLHALSKIQGVMNNNSKDSLSDSTRSQQCSIENLNVLRSSQDTIISGIKCNEKGTLSSPNGNEEKTNKDFYNNAANLKPDSHELQASSIEDDSFFDLVSRFQGERMDDQRCTLNAQENKENHHVLGKRRGSLSTNSTNSNGNTQTTAGSPASLSSDATTNVKEDLLELIAGMQSKRLDEQRASLPRLPGLNNNNNNNHPPPRLLRRFSTDSTNVPDDSFFDMLMRCQGTRIEDQRSAFPSEQSPAPTVPDEDFFSLIVRLQSGRIEDQRSSIAIKTPIKHTNKASAKSNGGNIPNKIKLGLKTGRSSKPKH